MPTGQRGRGPWQSPECVEAGNSGRPAAIRPSAGRPEESASE